MVDSLMTSECQDWSTGDFTSPTRLFVQHACTDRCCKSNTLTRLDQLMVAQCLQVSVRHREHQDEMLRPRVGCRHFVPCLCIRLTVRADHSLVPRYLVFRPEHFLNAIWDPAVWKSSHAYGCSSIVVGLELGWHSSCCRRPSKM